MILHILGRQWLLMINIFFIFIIYVIDPHYIHLKIVEKVLIYHYVKLAAFKCKSEVGTVKNIIRKCFFPVLNSGLKQMPQTKYILTLNNR